LPLTYINYSIYETCIYIFHNYIFSIYSFGQSDILQLNVKTNISDVINYQYLFPDFVEGRVLHRDNTTFRGKLNYNMKLNELQFIQNNDILSIIN
jgi:hypothetical protein